MRQTRLGLLACLIALTALAGALWTVSTKNLPGTVNLTEIGRYQFAISATLTKLRFGISGFVYSPGIYNALKAGGLSEDQDINHFLSDIHALDNLRSPSLIQHAIDTARTANVPAPANVMQGGHYRDLRGFVNDDLGVATLVRMAFALFGENLPGVTYTYFLILGISVLLYTMAYYYRPAPMAALALMAVALYLICSSALINFEVLDVKDTRFLGTLAAIPVLHVLVALVSSRTMKALDYILLAAQSAIFAFAIHLRVSVGWAVIGLILLILGVSLYQICYGRWQWRTVLNWRRPWSLPVFAVVFGTLALGHILASMAVHPLYSTEGDLTHHQFWYGVYYSLAINPDWDKRFLKSVNGAQGDDMPAETLRLAIAKLPAEEQKQYMNDYYNSFNHSGGEVLLRRLFFEFVRQHPRFAFDLFFIVKPTRILQNAVHFYQSIIAINSAWATAIISSDPDYAVYYARLRQSTKPTRIWAGLAFAGLLLLICWIAFNDRESPQLLSKLSAIGICFAVLAWLPNWLIALNPLVMVDNFVWTLFSAGLIFVFAVLWGANKMLRGPERV
jgi:hypothetical protein